jgi:hypothetical protein
MARRQQRRPGVYGPYLHRQRWRVHLVDERGRTTRESYATEEDAQKVIRDTKRKLSRLPRFEYLLDGTPCHVRRLRRHSNQRRCSRPRRRVRARVRPRPLLRQLEQQACNQALLQHPPPDAVTAGYCQSAYLSFPSARADPHGASVRRNASSLVWTEHIPSTRSYRRIVEVPPGPGSGETGVDHS